MCLLESSTSCHSYFRAFLYGMCLFFFPSVYLETVSIGCTWKMIVNYKLIISKKTGEGVGFVTNINDKSSILKMEKRK